MTLRSTSVPGEAESISTSLYKSVLTSKSPVNPARVDFRPFLPLKAKIDLIVFTCKEKDLGKDELALFHKNIKDGTPNSPRIKETMMDVVAHGSRFMIPACAIYSTS